MKYKQALQIGTQAEGTIQCTYAVIYDNNKKPLFALQRRCFESQKAYYRYMQEDAHDYFDSQKFSDVILVYTGDGKEGILAWQDRGDGGNLENAPTGLLDFDLPLVAVTGYSDQTYVPAKLLSPAVAYIKKTIASAQHRNKYILWEIDEETEEQRKLGEQWTMPNIDKLNKTAQKGKKIDYTIETKHLAAKWEDLLARINADDVVYVKPAAFRWEVTKLKQNPDTEESRELREAKTRMEIAKQKYDAAKAVLVAAGLTNLI